MPRNFPPHGGPEMAPVLPLVSRISHPEHLKAAPWSDAGDAGRGPGDGEAGGPPPGSRARQNPLMAERV